MAERTRTRRSTHPRGIGSGEGPTGAGPERAGGPRERTGGVPERTGGTVERTSETRSPSRGGAPSKRRRERDPGDVEERSSEAIHDDIRRTRREMDETMGALERKLTPGRIVDDVLNRFRGPDGGGIGDVAGGIGSGVRDHPVPLLLMGLGLGWLAVERMTGDRSGARGGRPYAPGGEGTGSDRDDEEGDGLIQRTREKASSVVESAKDAVSGAGDKASSARDKGRDLGHRASEAGHRAADLGHRATDLGHRAAEGGRRAGRGIRSFVRDQPLAAAALSFGAGLASGVAVPSTRWEDETMGETAREVRGEAKRAAKDTGRRAGEVASTAVQAGTQEAVRAGREEMETEREEMRGESGAAGSEEMGPTRDRPGSGGTGF